MLHAFPRSMAWLLSLLTVTILLLSPAANLPVQAATDDVPVPFINDNNVEVWTVGAGQVYWANNCFSDEFNTVAELRRKAAGGGAIQTLQIINVDAPGETCNTYASQESTGDGLYYYEESFDPVEYRIMRMPLAPPFVPVLVKTLAASEVPNLGRAFLADGEYLYWPVSFTNKIFRTLKDGSGPIETVADTEPGPLDLIIVGTTIFWTDSVGVWGKSINCDELPCGGTAKTKYDDFPTGAFAYGLIYKPVSGFGPFGDGFRLYWVEHTGSSYKIVYRACNFISPCFLEVAPNPPEPTPEPPDPVTFHATSVNRIIGDLVLVGDNIFWTENDAGAGFVFRKAYNASLADPAGEIGSNQTNIGPQLHAVNNLLYFARHGANGGIFTLPLDATVVTRDFLLEGMEVTQGIQNLANDVRLVGKKTTYVRAYAKQLAGPSATNVEVLLYGTRNNIPLPGSPLKPVNGVRPLITGGSYDRARLSDGWYFLLPENWLTAGKIKLQAVVDPRHLHTDPNLSDNAYPPGSPIELTFENQPPVCVMTVPVRTHTPLPSVYDPNVGIMVSNFDRRWPVPAAWIYRDTEPVEELGLCSWHGIPYPCFGAYELEDGWGLTNGIPDRDKVIASLWTRALLSFNPDACDDIGAPVHFMGLVHPDANNGGAAGYASTISNQSWVQLPDHGSMSNAWDASEEGSTMAQELAHNHGRKHVNCGSPDNIDNGYPYPPCQIANVGAASHYGFDMATLRPIRPDRAADFMSYAGNTWVSDYTWESLLDKFATTSVAAVSAAPLATLQGEHVFVTGLVDAETARGEISMVLILPAETLPPETRQQFVVQAAGVTHGDEPHVAYKLRLLDATGQPVIPDRSLTLLPIDDHTDESAAQLFHDLFPKPAGAVAKIQLVADNTVVFTIEVGLSQPVVTIQQPTAGAVIEDAMTIQWTASDPDPNDQLKFTVQYSHDNGASWHTLAINLPSTPDPVNILTLNDLGSLQGSAPNQARIRVLASDGYNTTIATSQGFTVENRPPLPMILAPVAGQVLPGGEAVVLQGSATDPEDGGLDGSALQWHVDGVSYGGDSAVAVAGLASMTHTVALAATDSNSQTVTTTVSFNLAPLSVPLVAAPTLDGACSDESYTQGISLLPSGYDDDTQANVRILRSADYLWACFSNLKLGAAAPGAYVGLRVDINNSRDAQAQATDAAFFAGENGDVFARVGNGAGDFVAPGPVGFEGQVVIDVSGWSAELRIEKETLGGWNHLVNLAVGHHSLMAEDDDYGWPHPSVWGKPNTWSAAALGLQPVLNRVSPSAVPVLGPTFTLTVEGSSFISGTQVLWNGDVLPTTFITGEVLSAQVDGSRLATAGVVQIATRSPQPDNFTSNALPFVVEAPAPLITSISPGNAKEESGPLTLTINGSNFVSGATVLWNGVVLPAQFVNSSQLKVVIEAALLAAGQEAGIAVNNPDPDSQISPVFTFQVLSSSVLYVPGLFKEP